MQNTLNMMKIIWAAMLFSQVPLLLALYTSPENLTDPSLSQPLPTLLPILALLAFSQLILSVVLPKIMLKTSLKSANESVQSGTVKKEITLDILQKLQVALIIKLALLEAISLMGFVLALTSQNIRFYFYFAAVSIVGFIFSFPSKKFLEKLSGGYRFINSYE